MGKVTNNNKDISKYAGKTVAYDGEHYTMSGWSKNISKEAVLDFNRNTDLITPVIKEMMDLNKEGYIAESSWKDHNIEYRFNASHAEKQVAVYGNQQIGVTKEMCLDCQSYFTAKAKMENVEYIIADPSTIHIFTAWGEHMQKPNKEKR